MDALKYKVRGLDCAEEVTALRQTVGRLSGVRDLSFNLLEGSMRVERAGADHPPDALIMAAVQQAGLTAEIWRDAAATLDDPGEQRDRRRRAILLGTGGAALLGAIGTHALLHGGLRHALAGCGPGPDTSLPPVVSVLYGLSVLASGWHLAPRVWAALRARRADMNLLMTLAVLGAAGLGEWFEAATVVFLFGLAQMLESWSVGRARHAIQALLDTAPPVAHRICPHDGDISDRPPESLAPGEWVLVRPGERVPLDGTVVEGRTSVNEAPLTGEARAVPKEPGDPVYAGTINHDGAIRLRVTRAAADSTLARIVRLVEEAQSRRAPIERWVDRFARVYTPAVIVVALVTAIVPPLWGGQPERWFYQALVLLMIACPCALVISTPVAIVAGLTAAMRRGVLVKGGAHLERLAQVTDCAFDKTGTLTRGEPVVIAIHRCDQTLTETAAWRLAAALESASAHPVGRAFAAHAATDPLPLPAVSDFRALPGRGAEGLLTLPTGPRRVWIGNRRLWRERAPGHNAAAEALVEREARAGRTVVTLGADQDLLAQFVLDDPPRPEAAATVAALRAAGIRQHHMLTGDSAGAAQRIGAATGMDTVAAELLPEQKLARLHALAADGARIAMIGDGINDAPALAAAHVGIAMGAVASAAAIEAADVALLGDELTPLPWLIGHARRVLLTIRVNITGALAFKALFLGLSLTGHASLWLAILADTGASLLVTAYSLRLLRGAPPL